MKENNCLVSDSKILEKEQQEVFEKTEFEQAQNDLADWLGWE